MVGGGLVGVPRLVVAAPGEPLLALPARLGPALDVPLADLVLGQLAPRPAGPPRSRPCAPAARPTSPAAARPSAKAAAVAGPSYAASKGSRAANVDPSAALPRSAPSTVVRAVAPWRSRSWRPSARVGPRGPARRSALSARGTERVPNHRRGVAQFARPAMIRRPFARVRPPWTSARAAARHRRRCWWAGAAASRVASASRVPSAATRRASSPAKSPRSSSSSPRAPSSSAPWTYASATAARTACRPRTCTPWAARPRSRSPSPETAGPST